MKGPKALKEIHKIMEKIYEEEKDLSANQRVARIREESEKYLKDRKLHLKRAKPRTMKHSAA